MNRRAWEAVCRHWDCRPVERVESKDGTILIAEGYVEPTRDKPEYPWGYYKMLWAIDRGKMCEGGELEIQAFHDPLMDQATKPRARINAAVQQARAYIALMYQLGRWEEKVPEIKTAQQFIGEVEGNA